MRQPRHDSIRSRRWGGVAGILFVAFALVAPDPAVREGASPDRIRQFFLDSRQSLGLMLILIGIGFVLFLYFSVVLQGTARRIEPRSDSMATLLLVSAALIAGFYVLGAALRSVPATAAGAGASAALLEPVFHITNTANDVLVQIATFWRGAMLVSAGNLILRTAMVPRWIGWMAALLGAGSFLGGVSFIESPLEPALGTLGFTSFILFHLWVLIASVALAIGGWSRERVDSEVRVPQMT